MAHLLFNAITFTDSRQNDTNPICHPWHYQHSRLVCVLGIAVQSGLRFRNLIPNVINHIGVRDHHAVISSFHWSSKHLYSYVCLSMSRNEIQPGTRGRWQVDQWLSYVHVVWFRYNMGLSFLLSLTRNAYLDWSHTAMNQFKIQVDLRGCWLWFD